MDGINLIAVEEFFKQQSRDGSISISMFRAWCDEMSRTVARNGSRRHRGTDSKPKGKSKDKPKGSGKKAKTKVKAKGGKVSTAKPESKSGKESEKDVMKKSALKKLSVLLKIDLSDELLESRWKDNILPFLKSEQADNIYTVLDHLIRTPIVPEPEDWADLDEAQRKKKKTKVSLSKLFTDAKLTPMESNLTREFIPFLRGREGIGGVTVTPGGKGSKKKTEKKSQKSSAGPDSGGAAEAATASPGSQ
jgi:hypothetical protein